MGIAAGINKYASLAGLVLVCGLPVVACHPQVTKVSTDGGKGTRQGSPPLCFDYRGEAQATAQAGVSNIWAYLNNTCSYAVECSIYDDVTEQEHPVKLAGYQQLRFLLMAGAPANRVKLKLDCNWSP